MSWLWSFLFKNLGSIKSVLTLWPVLSHLGLLIDFAKVSHAIFIEQMLGKKKLPECEQYERFLRLANLILENKIIKLPDTQREAIQGAIEALAERAQCNLPPNN